MCDHTGPFGGDLICQRIDTHTPGHGCTFESTSGDVRGQEKSDGGGDGE